MHISDVESEIQREVRNRNYLPRYQLRLAEEQRAGELILLERLEGKYRSRRKARKSARRRRHREMVAKPLSPCRGSCSESALGIYGRHRHSRGKEMNKEKETVRCTQCELVQWADHANCRRCGQVLPSPVVNVVERVVEKIVFRQDPQCLLNLQEASKLISAAAARLEESTAHRQIPVHLNSLSTFETFPTLDEMERTMILAAYRKSDRKPVEAARLLGIGKTTFYRKLREIRQIAA
ncbi:MAG: helix-turn-helix domain-containing protein [Terriglobia bacterium]|nr:helix-turn-helix domain-containing protein [Terriglobia bacterium]